MIKITKIPSAVRLWLKEQLGNIKSVTALKGATSSLLYKIEAENKTAVLRLYNNQEWLNKEPDLAQHEAASLDWAHQVLPSKVPKVLAVDETGKYCDLPAVLMSFVEGDVQIQPQTLDPWLRELASILSTLHSTPFPQEFDWHYFAYSDVETLQVPEWTRHPDLWKKAIHLSQCLPPEDQQRIIHRDFHPVNVLWSDGRISGIVDWVNACIGPIGVDVGHCRMNLVALFGVEAAERFLHYYCTFNPTFRYTLYWDLVSYLDFVYPGPPEVYQGWQDYGVTDLTKEIVTHRLENYLEYLFLSQT
ncbi:phosphotransferase family protein [Pullulanibacillus pueri]|uniref:phosphotransferase family protein n=1 Tax=Pullulanibacillus pueri TaxID=1437324 RepID=UPI00166E756A|nr:aminoglycoside phosphotransferase family protein [Pullulanibacillus pueri]